VLVSYRVKVDGRESRVQIVALRPQLRVRVGELEHQVSEPRARAESVELRLDGVLHRGWRCIVGDTVYVRLKGRTYAVQLPGPERQMDGATGQDEIRASMPGVVVATHCTPGQVVSAGDALLTLESMKLQMTVVASHAATVLAVHVQPEAVFERGALLVSLMHTEAEKP
jgi:biotin carboxyl carrier protein